MGFKFPWEADAPSAYDGPITLTPDGGPFLYNDAVPYEMLLAAGVIIPSWLVVYAVMHALLREGDEEGLANGFVGFGV